ncbi:MAG: undecaprenyl-diphosphate phosphatase [Clostridiales Family XIII bacterium]|jgi:undecaprenyl-diphosphatase|nr:undecaprenyl-diphosphate phosphatase [Clostridiales Family XIII bacterium]
MTVLESFILGLAQGLTEFLPVSSSGHLALLEHFFGIEEGNVVSFAVLLHVGTLFSIFAVYYREIWNLILELLAVIRDVVRGRGPQINLNETRRLGFLIIAATLPTVLIGLLFQDLVSKLYGTLFAIGAGLVITGTVLFVSERVAPGVRGVKDMKFRHAVFVGILQSVALCPGISRSGSTIVGGLFAGLTREFAVRFAFLISIPSVLGAVVLEAPDAFRGGMDAAMLLPVIVGVAVSALSGFFAIKTMIRIVSGKKLYYFSFYTWALGAAVVAYHFFG